MIELNEQVVDNSMFDYLNNLPEPSDKSACFIYNNYSPNENCDRMYFQPDNALKIDSIRIELERLKSNEVVDDSAYYYLLACLLSAVPYVANITGVYAAYLKHWDIRTYNKLELKPLPIIKSNKSCRAYNLDAKKVGSLESFDLVYIDTPYNSRQYLPNYHILETIAKYDYPEIKGVTGMRDYVRSDFCQKNKVMGAFYDLLNSLKTRYVLLSYNTEGLITTEEMFDILSNYGVVKLFEFPYRRYKSKIPNNTDGLKEQIYFVEVTR
jgi:adenine-specific DNA-methyltransferase